MPTTTGSTWHSITKEKEELEYKRKRKRKGNKERAEHKVSKH